MSRKFVVGLRASLLSGVSVLVAGAAFAQEAPTSAGAEANEVEELVVVGSQIKGTSVTGVLPVTVVDVDDIAANGATSGDDLFRAIPQAGDVAFNESRDTGGINDARGDTASVNLRALGTGNTLMLLNGRRMVLHPGTQSENLVPVATVNTNAIPVKGVRRVEVLRDGAAAIYGTDAVAGVVNTVLKSNLNGFSVELESGFAEGTGMREHEGSFEFGRNINGGRTNVSIFGQFLTRDPLWAREREYARSSDLRPLVAGTIFDGDTDFNNTSTVTAWAEGIRLDPVTFKASTAATRVNGVALTSSGVFHIQPDTNAGCVASGFSPGTCWDDASLATLTSDANLKYNVNAERTLTGATDRGNLFLFLNHSFDNGLEAYAEAGGYFADYNSVREQDAALASARIIMPANAYWNPLGPVGSPNRLAGLTTGTAGAAFPAAGAPVQLQDYRPIDAGPQHINVESQVLRYLAGVRGEFRGFDWDSAVVYSTARTDDTMTGISSTLFQQAVAGTTASAYNPFVGGDPLNPSAGASMRNDPATIASFMIDVSRISETSMAMWDFKISRPDLFELPGGRVGMAAGVEVRRETFKDDRDDRLDGKITFTNLAGETNRSDVMGVSSTPDTSGSRSVQSAFVEFAVPVISPDMNIPLVRSVDLQLAARHENYSIFGGVTKPKVAASWQPVEGLRFRGSWSQGFRAPNLPQLFESGVQRSNTRTDLIKCEAQIRSGAITNFDACTNASQGVVSNRSGSKSLTPEEATNLTYGLVFEPTFLPREFGRLTFTADYWRVDQKDIIGIFGDTNALALDYLMRVRGESNPNVRRADPTPEEEAMFAGTGLAPVGRVIEVIDNYINLTPRKVEGADFSLFYDIKDTWLGDFSIKLNAAKLLTFYQEPSEDAAALLAAQKAGEINRGFNVVGAADLIRENGRPEWRGNATVTWRKDQWGAGYYSSYVSSVLDTSANLPDGTLWEVDDVLTHNVYLQYTVDADGWTDGTRIRVGVRNLQNKQPPLADQSFGYLGELHSSRGRWWYLNMRKRF